MDVKIPCHCGAVIIDQTDDLPHKAHLIPDQEWFATCDTIDHAIIDLMAAGQLDKEAAYHLTRRILSRATRLLWQCHACGRLYIDDPHKGLQCYAPESEQTSREILRGREGHG